MRTSFLAMSIGAAVFGLAVSSDPASAACTRLGFSVNDYGKDGPTADAKRLLDKYIAKWAADNGIGKYTTGKKDVKCELFLDFGFFDEHTCRAEASVCWDGPAVKGTGTQQAATGDAAPASEAKPAKKAAKAKAEIETGSTTASEPAAKPAKEAPAEETPPVEESKGDPDPASPNYGGANPAAN